jgi:hypothetical protein
MNRYRLYIGAVVILGFAGYLAYQLYFPVMVARSITNETSYLVPKNVQVRIQKIRKPVNEGAETLVQTMHRSGITIDQILHAIDEATEEQAFSMLDELNGMEIQSADQFFSLAKNHFPVEFDVEVFREPFSEKVNIQLIRKAIKYANIYRKREEFDAETAKSIAKRILLQKEEEFRKIIAKNSDQ